MKEVRIGRDQGERVTITVLGREHPNLTDWEDGNWLVCGVKVEAGAWSGSHRASLRSEEFERFLSALRELSRTLRGTAEFSPMEPWIRLQLRGDGLGHVDVSGVADDDVAIGNKL